MTAESTLPPTTRAGPARGHPRSSLPVALSAALATLLRHLYGSQAHRATLEFDPDPVRAPELTQLRVWHNDGTRLRPDLATLRQELVAGSFETLAEFE